MIFGHSIVRRLAQHVSPSSTDSRLSLDLKLQDSATIDWVGHGGLTVQRLKYLDYSIRMGTFISIIPNQSKAMQGTSLK